MVVATFYNQRSVAGQHVKEGNNIIGWTGLSCGEFCDNDVRLQHRVLVYNPGQFIWMPALLKEVEPRPSDASRKKQDKIGAKEDL